MKQSVITFLVVLLMVAIKEPSWAQKTWDGGAGTTNWTNANNWNPDGVPASTDNVDLTTGTAASITLADAGNCRTLKIGNSFSLTISGGSAQLVVASDGSTGVDVDIQSSGTITAGSSGTSPRLKFTNTSDEFQIQSGGQYTHGGGAFPRYNSPADIVYDFQSGSTVQFNTGTGFTSTPSYGNLKLNNGGSITHGSGTLTVSNNLTIETATDFKIIDGGGSNATVTLTGNLVINGTGTFTGNVSSSSATATLNIGGSISSGSFSPGGGSGGFVLNFTGGATSITFSPSAAYTTNGNVTVANTPAGKTVTVGVNFTVSSGNTLTITGILTLNTASTFTNVGTVSGAGTFKIQSGGNSVYLDNQGTFSAPLNVNTGTAYVYKSTSPYTTTFSGQITIDGGGVVNTSGAAYTIQANADVTVTGTLSGDGTFTFNGASKTFSNGGTVSAATVNFNNISQILTGAGSFSGNTAIIEDLASLATGSNHQLHYVTIDGTLNISDDNLSLTGSPNPLSITGTLTQNLSSTITYKGGSAQNVLSSVTYENLGVDKSGSTATLAGDITVSGNLTVTAGTLNTNEMDLSVAGNTSISGTLSVTSGTTGILGFNNVTINSGGTYNNNTVNDAVLISGNFQNDGTLNAGSGTYTFSGTTKTFSGTNTISIANTTVSGTYTNNGTLTVGTALSGFGTLTNGASGTLNIGGTSGITTLNASTAGNTVNYTAASQTVKPITYHNLSLSGSGTPVLTSVNTINGNFTLSGTVTATPAEALTIGGNFTIGAGTTFNAGSYIHVLKGNWSNSGTFNEGTSTIKMNGTSAQTMSGSTFNNLTIDNASGVTLLSTETVNGTLTVTNGDLDLNSYTLTLGSTATMSETAGNTVIGSSGKITTTRDLNAPSGLNVAGMGAELTTSINMGSTTIERSHTIQSYGGNSGIKRYFNINPMTNSGLNATLVFHYDESELNGIIESNLRLFKSTNSGTSWTSEGGSVDAGANTVTKTGIDAFSRWTLGDVNNPLPVELTSFSASLKSNKVYLKWKTATEVNNYGFDVERTTPLSPPFQGGESETRGGWEKIGFVQGHGTVNTPQSYSFVDQLTPLDLTHKSISYRLKQIDRDGKYEYSSVVNVTPSSTSKTIMLMQNYPNPFSKTSQGISSTNIAFRLPREEKVSLTVYDVLGHEVTRLVDGVSLDAGNYVYTFFGNELPVGMYVYELRTEGSVIRKQMILKK